MNYGFFDYKYNITDYHGEHYGSGYQTAFLVGTILLSMLLAVLLRKVSKEKVTRAVGFIGIGMTALYLIKTIWESHFDVATGRGFNTFLLPFDTCSILMWAALIGGFGKGFFADWAKKWLCVYGFVGGFANALFLQALKYYPFFSFGALYSMLWHAVMIFLSWWLLISGTVKFEWEDIFRAYSFHLVFSVLPIAINFNIRHMNWMLYDDAGGVPLIESLCAPYADTWAATFIMLFTYLAIGAVLGGIYMLIPILGRAAGKLLRKKKE